MRPIGSIGWLSPCPRFLDELQQTTTPDLASLSCWCIASLEMGAELCLSPLQLRNARLHRTTFQELYNTLCHTPIAHGNQS